MAEKTLAENVGTATTVIHEVKEAIVSKGVDIPEGTHATEYPGYIGQMTANTDFEELKERVEANGASIAAMEDVTLWGQELKGNVTGDLKSVGAIDFKDDNLYSIGTSEKRARIIYARTGVRVGETTNYPDGKDGIRLNSNGSIGIQCSDESIAGGNYPRMNFYHGSDPEVISSMHEATPGVLSIPNKFRVGEQPEQRRIVLFGRGRILF